MKKVYLTPEQVYTLREAPKDRFNLENAVRHFEQTHGNDLPPIIVVEAKLLASNIVQSPTLNRLIEHYTHIQNKKGPLLKDYSKDIEELEKFKTTTSLTENKLYLVDGLTRFLAAGITGYKATGLHVETPDDFEELKVRIQQNRLPPFCSATTSFQNILSQEGDPFISEKGKARFRLKTVRDLVEELAPYFENYSQRF